MGLHTIHGKAMERDDNFRGSIRNRNYWYIPYMAKPWKEMTTLGVRLSTLKQLKGLSVHTIHGKAMLRDDNFRGSIRTR